MCSSEFVEWKAASISFARTSLRARDSGDIFAASSLKFRAFIRFHSSKFLEVIVVNAVRERNVEFVPPVLTRLVSADQEDSAAKGIKRVEDSVRAARVLNTKLAHVGMPGSDDTRGVRRAEGHALRLKQDDGGANGFLFFGREGVPPVFKFLGESTSHST